MAARLPREVWALVVISFVIALGFGIVAPALPAFAHSFDVSVTAVSVVISAFAFARLAFAPTSGRLVTKLGERPVFTIGILIVGVSTGACAFAESYWQLLVFRAAGGFGSTMFTVSALALLVRLSPAELRGRSTGLWATSFLTGSICGPLVGGGLIGFSLRAPFLIYGAALVLSAALGWTLLRGAVPDPAEATADGPALRVRDALRHSTYRATLASNFANGWAVFGVRMSLVPLFVTEVLRRDETLAGIALSVFAVGNVLVLLFSGKVTDAIGRRPPATIGLVVAGLSTIAIGFTTNVATFLLATLVTGLGVGLLTPAQSAAVADVIGSRARGGPLLAGFQMAADVGAIVGPVLAGVIADEVSYKASFFVTGAVMLVAALVWTRAAETRPVAAEHPWAEDIDECARIDEGPPVPSGRPTRPGRSIT